MLRINFFLSEQQFASLKAMAKTTGLSYSELIRRAIDEYLKRHFRGA